MNTSILLLLIIVALGGYFVSAGLTAKKNGLRAEMRAKFVYAFIFAVFALAIFAKEYRNIVALFSN